MNMILTLSSFLFPLITFPYASRILTAEGTGKVSFAISLVYYFVLISQLGIPTYGIRECAKNKDDKLALSKTVHELLTISIITSSISYLLLFILLSTVSRFQTDKILYIIASSEILLGALGVEWLYKGLERYDYITIRSIFFKTVALIAMFLLIHKKEDYIIYCAITLFAACASYILNFINLPRIIFIKPLDSYDLKKHLKPVLIFFAMSCAAAIYTNLDAVMLGFIKSDIDVGYYNAAVKIKNILVAIVTSIGTVLLPRLTYYIENGQSEALYKIAKKSFSLVILISCSFCVYFLIFADYGIEFLCGSGYKGAILPMRIIMPTIIAIGLSNLYGIQILVPLGKEIKLFIAEIVGAFVDFLLNIILIPYFASAGAAIGTLFAEVIVTLLCYIFVKQELRESISEIRFKQIIIALLLAGISSIWIRFYSLTSFVTLVASSVVFFGVFAGYLLIVKEEILLEIWNTIIVKLKKCVTIFKK